MELTLEIKIETEADDIMEITIEPWGGEYRITLEDDTRSHVSMPLKTFDEVAAIVAKFREANLILTGDKNDE